MVWTCLKKQQDIHCHLTIYALSAKKEDNDPDWTGRSFKETHTLVRKQNIGGGLSDIQLRNDSMTTRDHGDDDDNYDDDDDDFVNSWLGINVIWFYV